MPFEDTPLPPAQTHPVALQPPNLGGLPVWAYLALGFVLISTIGVLCYVVYSCYYSLRLNITTTLPRYSVVSPPKTRRPKKKGWRPSSNDSQQQPMLSDISMNHGSAVDRMVNLVPLTHASPICASHIPPVAFPTTAVSPPAKLRTIPTYDMHNIRFASPSNLAIYTNPKLVPVQGSAVPLAYDSQNNLFGNLFTPMTVPSRKAGMSVKRSMSAFRGKGGLSVGKENYKQVPGQAGVS
ncbi:hypothetical protein DFH08DRAFT_946686 [Mycena albidolilacea]|uniref:Uncharacterized protein n=1 Tax=Mycena albidolilacea TaxID=1033008 RepID=A0AAD7F5Q4_9AGAR|nr:hypothetical protein DFH08DRAFT_946686 [Mycena albidolilacea]